MDGSEMITSRRGFLAGLVSALAAPAIVQATNIMPVKVMPDVLTLDEYFDRVMSPNLLTLQMIVHEAVRQFQNTNAYLSKDWDRVFADGPPAHVGTQLRVRLPNDFTVKPMFALSLSSARSSFMDRERQQRVKDLLGS